ncbi:uncharacterized protein LY79DRAFT_583495 [Colletotrichum navitas]|uniref:NmrA-like domain-containing protein n=1 Tax=Colletotrichum navitas TaxID=681940 RepID=A0AAD8V0U3_9PEZI|nr:uncharacterized protein LY79DRAFT_583495 [Colletotrichum navitas]KAK1573645.1 hypothetical protein LY79DRAFT_583495 [Colletotrichum navitas]
MKLNRAVAKVLDRASSDISNLPTHITKVEVDINDATSLIEALQDIDIVVSLVGHEGVQRQHGFVRAIPKTNVKLFSQSDLAGRGLYAQGAAYASIFSTTPISQLENRAIALCELVPTEKDITVTLESKHGIGPQTSSRGLEKIKDEVEQWLESVSVFTVAWYCHKIWGAGQQSQMIGSNFWEVDDYQKATLEDLILGEKLEAYREMPDQVVEYSRHCFQHGRQSDFQPAAITESSLPILTAL